MMKKLLCTLLFAFLAIGVTQAQADINVQGNGNDIASGDVTPSTTDGTDFGQVNVSTSSAEQLFVIQNTGADPLSIFLATTTNTAVFTVTTAPAASGKELLIVPTTRLYNRDAKFTPTVLVQGRVATPFVLINPDDANSLKLADGDSVEISFGAKSVVVRAEITEQVSAGAVYLPRQLTDEATPLVPTTGTLVN